MTLIEQEISIYPETGIINPYINTKFCLTVEMIDFFNQYLLIFKDYPDAKIAKEFALKFDIDKSAAKSIEHDYVVVNRARIYKRIENLFKIGKITDEIIKEIASDFGLDTINAEKYVRRCAMDRLDTASGIYIAEK